MVRWNGRDWGAAALMAIAAFALGAIAFWSPGLGTSLLVLVAAWLNGRDLRNLTPFKTRWVIPRVGRRRAIALYLALSLWAILWIGSIALMTYQARTKSHPAFSGFSSVMLSLASIMLMLGLLRRSEFFEVSYPDAPPDLPRG